MAKKTVDLVQVILDNPGCVAIIDNDYWRLYRVHPDTLEDDNEIEAAVLASSEDTFKPHLGDGGYGSGNCYGGDILQALAVIVGIKIESV